MIRKISSNKMPVENSTPKRKYLFKTNLKCQKMDSTTEIYFREIVENFIKLVQAVHEVGDKVQKKRLTEKRAELQQVISLIEPEGPEPEGKKAKLDSSDEKDDESHEVYEDRWTKYHPNDPEAFQSNYHSTPKDLEIVLSKAKTLKKLIFTVHHSLPNSVKLDFPRLKYLWLNFRNSESMEKFAQAKYPCLERLRIGTRDLEFLAQNCDKFLANAPKLKSIQLHDEAIVLSEEALNNLYDIFAENGVLVYLGYVFDTSSQAHLDKSIFHERYEDRDPKVFVKYEQELRKFISWCRKNEKYGDINDVN